MELRRDAIGYGTAKLSDFGFRTQTDRSGRVKVTQVRIGDRPFLPSPRFWSSIAANYGLGASPWRYFSPAETFSRIASVHPDHGLRYAYENHGGEGKDLLLGIARAHKPVVPYADLLGLVEKYDGEDGSYCDGRVISFHRPTAAEEFAIAGDQFCPRFMLSVPVDGYGKPAVYLCVLRAVCRNGMVAYANAFQSQLATGKQADSVIHSIARALDSYSNDEGYAAIQQRLDASAKSWASVRETANLYKLLAKLLSNDHVHRGVQSPQAEESVPNAYGEHGLLGSYNRLTGDMAEMYGVASVETLPVKPQSVLPAKCSMFDLLNYATEIATHHAVTPFGKLQLQGWVGRTIADRNGFDLEGTRERFSDFADFHTNVRLANQLTGSKI
jgi:hypothetical protein